MDNQQRSIENRLHWLGGIIDGEGTVTVCMSRQRRSPINYSPRICFVNTDPRIIEEGTSILREMNIPYHISTAIKTTATVKECFRVNIGGMKRARRAAEVLVKYVVAKRPKMEALIEWIDYRFSLPHKHPQTAIDVAYLTRIRHKPIDPMLSIPFRDRTPGSVCKTDEDTVHAIVKAIE